MGRRSMVVTNSTLFLTILTCPDLAGEVHVWLSLTVLAFWGGGWKVEGWKVEGWKGRRC